MNDKTKISNGAIKVREAIEKAIETHRITMSDYEYILALAFEDGVLDNHEKALLEELQKMIATEHVEMIDEKYNGDQ